MKLALVGATGLVGREMIRVIEEFDFPVDEFLPVASAKSVGKTVNFKKSDVNIISIDQAIQRIPDIAVYSAGSEISLKTASLFSAKGTFVIDNSSAWRMYDDVPLVVPEVNISAVTEKTKIIANPNCSTIQLVVVLNPLYHHFGIKKVVVSTYQSVTGTGAAAVKQLFSERAGKFDEKVYPHQIDLNCFPHGGSFLDNGYTTEEMKLVQETRKILNDKSLDIQPTVVRIPVTGGHSESVYIEFSEAVNVDKAREILEFSPGITILDDTSANVYPMPLNVKGKNETFVGRIRAGVDNRFSLQLWVVADNLRKGAATNAIQIAQYISEKFL